MSSLAEIYFNYNKAIQQANSLDEAAKRLTRAAEASMETILSDVSRAWRSDNTPQYIKKGDKVKRDMLTSARNLRNIAQAIRTIAKRVRDAELEAWRIANARKS